MSAQYGVKPHGVSDAIGMFDVLMNAMTEQQVVREVFKNAIEGGDRYRKESDPNYRVSIYLGLDVEHYLEKQVAKFCCVDTGSGMTREDLIKFFSDVASSGHYGTQNGELNHGFGEKMAAAKVSPAGCLIQSWREGAQNGWACILKADPVTGASGILVDESGNPAIFKVGVDRMPQQIRAVGHGTKVTFWGRDVKETTLTPAFFNAGTNDTKFYLRQIINERFYTIPDYVDVNVTYAAHSVAKKGKGEGVGASYIGSKGQIKTNKVLGLLPTLKAHQLKPTETISETSGTIELSKGVVAHWSIMNRPVRKAEKGVMTVQSRKVDLIVTQGRVAVLYNNEIFDSTNNRQTIRHHKSGIFSVCDQVNIFFDVTNYQGKVGPNIARTTLHIDGNALGDSSFYDFYCEEFSNKLPDAIRQLEVEDLADTDDSADEFLKELLEDKCPTFEVSAAQLTDTYPKIDTNVEGDETITVYEPKERTKGSGSGGNGGRGGSKTGSNGNRSGVKGGPNDGDNGGQGFLNGQLGDKGRTLADPATIRDIIPIPASLSDGSMYHFVIPNGHHPGQLFINVDDEMFRSAIAEKLIPEAKKIYSILDEEAIEAKVACLTAYVLGADIISTLCMMEKRQRIKDSEFVLTGKQGLEFLAESRPSFWDDMGDIIYGSVKQAERIVGDRRSKRFANMSTTIKRR